MIWIKRHDDSEFITAISCDKERVFKQDLQEVSHLLQNEVTRLKPAELYSLLSDLYNRLE